MSNFFSKLIYHQASLNSRINLFSLIRGSISQKHFYRRALSSCAFNSKFELHLRNSIRIEVPVQEIRCSSNFSKCTSRNFYTGPFYFSSKSEKIVPFLLADIGEGITECEITQWFVKPGDKVAQFEKICEVQSDKAVVEISSRFDGTIQKLHFNVNDIAKVGSALVDIVVLDETAPSSSKVESPSLNESHPTPQLSNSSSPAPPSNPRAVLAAPAVRRMAREKGIPLDQIQGTGPNHRIVKEDLETYLSTLATNAPTSAPSTPFTSPTHRDSTSASPSSSATVKNEAWIPFTSTQKAMVKSMTQSLQIPHFVYTDEIRMDSLRQLKNELVMTTLKQDDLKLTYLPFMLKACSLALHQFPRLNATYSETQYRFCSNHNLGVAMDTPQGLLVPNLMDVQTHSILSLAKTLKEVQTLANQSKLSPMHFQNTTFTLSNIGAIGGDYMHPIIPVGQVCILATGKIRAVPRCSYDANNKVDRMEVHHVMPISISADHRYIDGATVARFVVVLKKFLENPSMMLVHLK